MKNIVRFLKPFYLGVVFVIALLFIQALTDLNLPNYMSDIVNIGIQQSGISHSSPEVISTDAMLFIKNFMSEEDFETVESHYTLIDPDSYTNLNLNTSLEEVLCKDKDLTQSENDFLDSTFSYASFSFIQFMQELSTLNPEAIPSDSTADGLEKGDMDSAFSTEIHMQDLYKINPMLTVIPPNIIETAIEKASEVDPFLVTQTGIAFVSSFYEELGIDTSSIQTNYIVNIGLRMLLIALIGGITTISVSFLTSKISAGVARNLREQLFNKINSFSNEEYDKFSTSSLITRSTNDVMQVQMVCMIGIRFIFYAPLMLIGGVIMAINKSASMAWIIALACILIILFIIIMLIFVMPKFQIIQKFIDRINLVAREALNGLMVIKAFGTSNHEKQRFAKANKDFADLNVFVGKVMSLMMPYMMFVMNITGILIVWVGAKQIESSNMQIGDMIAYIQYAMQIILSFLFIGMLFVFVPRAIVSANRINEVLTTEPTVVNPTSPLTSNTNTKGYLSFNNVSFTYANADEDALENISFTASPGQTVAFIGATGSGKTTLVNLIPRFYDVTKGEILLDGINIKDMDIKNLRSKIGYVPQKAILMSGTIESNIKYGDENTSEDIMMMSAKISQSLDFINAKEEGFNSHIAQGGSNVSGGQRQRLSIARALATLPEIFLFDDSFSALDYKTDVTLRQALKSSTKDATVIIIAQRVGTILDADIIHVLDEGKIIASGTHKELLKTCEAYYEIASTQLSKEELANE